MKFQKISSLNKITPSMLDLFDGVVLYFHHQKLTSPALATFEKFVSNGGGVLAIHSASASFKGNHKYYQILGGRFKEHGPIQEFEIYPEINLDPIFNNLISFSIKDELYLHEYSSDNQIQFFSVNNGKTEPMVWTHNYGQGRVCYVAPGHTANSINHPMMRQILQRGLMWVCGNPTYQEL